MAEELRLWAINVDLFRQCFAAPPELAEKLREVTDSMTATSSSNKPGGLLSKLGPLLRHPPTAPVIRPGIPNRQDGESMMTSRYIASDRLSASWILAQAWLDSLATAHTTIPLPRTQFDELEFDLVRAGVPTQISIRHLWRHSIDIPLRVTDDMTVGYMEHPTVLYLVEQWKNALPDLEEGTVEFATPLLDFASPFLEYSATAADQGTQGEDLIAWWTSR